MDPLSLILAAITAGAAASAKDTASAAIKDTYQGLKALIQRKFEGKPNAQAALIEYEEDPETYDKPLIKALNTHGIDQHDTIIDPPRQVFAFTQNQHELIGNHSLQNYGHLLKQSRK